MLQDFLPFIVIGVATGSVYGLAATGLVLTYKTSGIFNFAYGALASLSVFVFYFLHTEHGMAWPLAAALCLLVLAPLEGLGMELLARSLEPVGDTLKVVATVGLLLMVLGVGQLWYGSDSSSSVPQFLPQESIPIGGVEVGWDQIIVVIISVLACGVLYYFFRHVRLGAAMRGLVDNPDLVSMTGENPVRVRRWAWIIGMVFASMAGLLLAPSLNLDALVITMLVVQAFGAAAIGYFSSLPLTFVGGLFIGVAGALSAKYAVSISWLSGFPASLPFIILFVVLVVTPKARLAERRVVQSLPVRRSWYAPTRVRLVFGAVVVLALAFVPSLVGTNLSIWSNALIDVILFLSLGLLVRSAGQISLCHLAFAAVGAAAFGHFTDSYHMPWLVALILASLIAAPVGAIVSIPAIRLSGPDYSIGPWHMATDTGFYYVLLVIALLSVAAIIGIHRGRMGRLLAALSDSPTALETHGTTTNVVRVLIFCISATFASLSGALLAVLFHYSVGSNYSSFNSLILVALVVISVCGVPWYGLIAAFGYTIIPGYVTISNINIYLEIGFGFFATTYAMQRDKIPSVPRRLRNVLDRWGGRQPEPEPVDAEGRTTVFEGHPMAEDAVAAATAHLAAVTKSAEGPGIEVQHLAVYFGGLHAVEDVSLNAPMGLITGLVGPNGAGKTTTFNACSGLMKPTSGRILLHGADVTTTGPAGRSRLGLGRTFQRAELFNSLTVRENVALGREAFLAGSNPRTQLMSSRRDDATIDRAVAEAIELTGIGALAGLQAGLLPTGQRRMVELARVLAGPSSVLLLDEPSAGLDGAETQRFGQILQTALAERGMGILLVEHDMELVRQVCQNIFVLDFGRLIFEGTPEEMLASSTVRAAYLGSEGAGDPALATHEEEFT
ncbi:MAG: branched-chain amino acid ABC transporter permease/ATP-binding protein [Acidimicrobiales bacterium]